MTVPDGDTARRRNRRRIAIWLVLVAVLGATTAARWPAERPLLSTDVRALVPELAGATGRAEEAARRLAAPFERETVWLVSHEAPARAVDAARALGERLRASGAFDRVRVTASGDRLRRLQRALRPYRHGLMAPHDARRLEAAPAAFLERRLAAQFNLVGAVGGSPVGDPLGLFRRFLEAGLDAEGVARRLVDDVPVVEAEGRSHAVIEARVRRAAFEAAAEPALLRAWRDARAWSAQRSVRVRATGAPLYGAHASARAREEMTLIGGMSLLAIAVLVLVRFRSARPLVLTAAVIGAGVGAGFAAAVGLFGQIHLITLVFGATVIGVAVDYAFHYLADSLRADWTPERGLARIGPALGLALATSVAAFLSLALAPFPALREAAVFIAGGLVGAAATVALVLPGCTRPPAGAPAPRRRRWPRALRPGATIVVVLALAVPGVLLIEPDDDVRLLYSAPDRLSRDDDRIAELLPRPDSQRFLLVQAETGQALLERLETLRPALDRLVGEGTLEDYRLVTELLPSRQRQRRNERLLQGLVDGGRYAAALRRLGFGADRIDRLEREIGAAGPYVTPARGLAALGERRRALWLGCEAGACASAVVVAGAGTDYGPALRGLAEANDGVHWIDRVAAINDAMRRHRRFSLGLLVAALAVVAAVAAVVLGPRRGLRVAAVPACAIAVSLAALGYTGALFNVFNMMALLLVLGVGIDYAVFNERADAGGQPAAALAIGMAALTTLLAFGLLAFSATPVIRAFGITVVPGLVAAYLLALVVGRRDPRR